MIFPCPPQSGQSETICWTKGPTRACCTIRPCPLHVEQVWTSSGDLAPEPLQDSQEADNIAEISISSSLKICSSVTSCLSKTSFPRRERDEWPPPNIPEKMDSKPPLNKSSRLILTPWTPPGPKVQHHKRTRIRGQRTPRSTWSWGPPPPRPLLLFLF